MSLIPSSVCSAEIGEWEVSESFGVTRGEGGVGRVVSLGHRPVMDIDL